MQYHLSYGKGITGRRRKPGFLKLKSRMQAAPAKSPSPKLHLNAKPVKIWFPPDVKTKAEKEFYQAVSLKPVGGWTEGMVENGNALVIKHWERVKEYVKEHPYTGKSKKEAEEWIKKVIMTPEQEVVMWAERSLQAPLSHEGYEKYMQAFEKVVGKEQFERLFGGGVKEVKNGIKTEKKIVYCKSK